MRYWDPSGHLGLITNRYTATSPVIKDLHYVHFPSLSFLKFSIFTTLSWKWPPAFFATFKTQGIMHQIMFIHPTNSNMVSDIFLPLWRGNCFFFSSKHAHSGPSYCEMSHHFPWEPWQPCSRLQWLKHMFWICILVRKKCISTLCHTIPSFSFHFDSLLISVPQLLQTYPLLLHMLHILNELLHSYSEQWLLT